MSYTSAKKQFNKTYNQKHFNILQSTFWDTTEKIKQNYDSLTKILEENNKKPEAERKNFGITQESLNESYTFLTQEEERKNYLYFLKLILIIDIKIIMGCNSSSNRNINKPSEDSALRIKSASKEDEKTKIIEAKIVLLGDVNVGKTSIASRYCKNSFNDHHINTIGGAYQQQKVVLGNGSMVKLHIWDTSGQERFRAMTNLYYRDAQVAIITYDITNESTFSSIDFWIQELKYKVENDNMILCLVGNKCDVSSNERKIPTLKEKSFAKENNMIFYETSAKSG